MALIDLTGQTFGAVTVLRRANKGRAGLHAMWVVTCQCGSRTWIADSGNLRHGHVTSCARVVCPHNGKRKHGHNRRYGGKSPEYSSWNAMVQRCTNVNANWYQCYGGRGISVCPQWLNSFEAFLADAGPRPVGHSLDRIDNDGNYEPGNVRWATAKEQRQNQRPALQEK
jgi:hypothetical protein